MNATLDLIKELFQVDKFPGESFFRSESIYESSRKNIWDFSTIFLVTLTQREHSDHGNINFDYICVDLEERLS